MINDTSKEPVAREGTKNTPWGDTLPTHEGGISPSAKTRKLNTCGMCWRSADFLEDMTTNVGLLWFLISLA